MCGPLNYLLCRNVDGRLHQRHLHQLPRAIAAALFQRQKQREDGVHAAQRIADAAHHQRHIVVAGEPGQTAYLVGVHGEAHAVAPRAIQPKRRHTQQNGPRVQRAHRLPAQSPVVQHPGREVLRHHIGFGNKPVQQRQALRRIQVQRNAALAGVCALKERVEFPHGIARRVDKAHGVRALNGLDLDHICAQLGQQACGHRPRPKGGEVQHAQPRKGQRGFCPGGLRLRRGGGAPGELRRVLAQRGSGARRGRLALRSAKSVRRPRLHKAGGVCREDAPRAQVIHFGQRLPVSQRVDGNARQAQPLDNVGRIVPLRPAVNNALNEIQLFRAVNAVVKALVLRQFRLLDQRAKILPLLPGNGGKAHPAIPRGLNRRRNDGLRQRPGKKLRVEVVIIRQREAQTLEDGNIHMLPRAAAPRAEITGQRAHRRIDAGNPLANAPARAHRPPRRNAAPGGGAGSRLQGELGGGPPGPRPIAPPR